MAATTRLKERLNALLRPFNVRLDTWTIADRERQRILAVHARGGFVEPLYALPDELACFDETTLLQAYATYGDSLENLNAPARNTTGYNPLNEYFRTPDAEVLYLLVRSLKPRRIVEVGSGNSTRVARQAIADGHLTTELVAIDPLPRIDIAGVADRFVQRRLEEVELSIFQSLGVNDVLFIDSSHKAFVGNDVANLFCRIIPSLKPGVVIHVHDVFLPYEYPQKFAFDYPDWGEQYLLHAMLSGRRCEVLWPGHHVQRDRPDLRSKLPFLEGGMAQSFWFRWSCSRTQVSL